MSQVLPNALLILTACVATAHAQPPLKWEGTSHCWSKRSNGGARQSCDDLRGEIAIFPAPKGMVIDVASIKVWEGRNVHWSQKSCKVELSQYVEVIPGTGVVAPTPLRMIATGRSDATDHHVDYRCHISMQYGSFESLGTAATREVRP